MRARRSASPRPTRCGTVRTRTSPSVPFRRAWHDRRARGAPSRRRRSAVSVAAGGSRCSPPPSTQTTHVPHAPFPRHAASIGAPSECRRSMSVSPARATDVSPEGSYRIRITDPRTRRCRRRTPAPRTRPAGPPRTRRHRTPPRSRPRSRTGRRGASAARRRTTGRPHGPAGDAGGTRTARSRIGTGIRRAASDP